MVDRLLGRPREREAPSAPPPPADPRDAVWARVQLARNARRPHTLELVGQITDSFVELHGDRLFGDDGAIVGGPARIDGRRVMIVGHQKGADTDENIRRNFGMGKPEGFRKAIRLFELADPLQQLRTADHRHGVAQRSQVTLEGSAVALRNGLKQHFEQSRTFLQKN